MSQQHDAARIAIIGKLTDVRNVTFRGKQARRSRLLKVTTKDGDTYVVDSRSEVRFLSPAPANQ
jgi:hypothetical protein